MPSAAVLAVTLAATLTAVRAGTVRVAASPAALVAEGEKQLAARDYPQALANFLAAYAADPQPALLFTIAEVLRDLGRLADAANTYQRFLADPVAAPAGDERTSQARERLQRLDEQLTVVTIRVAPPGALLSIDGGPYVAAGGALVVRVRTGIHLLRSRTLDGATEPNELTLNGFEGEAKEVTPVLAGSAPRPAGPPPPERVIAWLVTGTGYAAADPAGPGRAVLDEDGAPIAPVTPRAEPGDRAEPAAPGEPDDIGSGAIAVLRVDGKGRGFAGGLGAAIARGRLETELMLLKADRIGGYLGLRYRFHTETWRPYAAAGIPGFVYDHDELQADMTTSTSERLAIGLRLAAGLEVRVSHHLSVLADLGYEHFFFIDRRYEADVFVPTLGVIGRL
ncbi:MAG TPA: hypothetical protein VGC42_15590 [Kofleriaceae bacterium]